MIVKLLTEHQLEFLSLKGGCRGSSESTLVKMPHCWKSRVTAHMILMTCTHNCRQPISSTLGLFMVIPMLKSHIYLTVMASQMGFKANLAMYSYDNLNTL